MEFHRTVYDSDERNLIMNHAYKLDDMYATTTSLAHSLAEQKDDLPLLWETIRAAEKEIDALPDGMVGLSEMHEYGYSWDEMLPADKGQGIGTVRGRCGGVPAPCGRFGNACGGQGGITGA